MIAYILWGLGGAIAGVVIRAISKEVAEAGDNGSVSMEHLNDLHRRNGQGGY